jgi:hypothetical protein
MEDQPSRDYNRGKIEGDQGNACFSMVVQHGIDHNSPDVNVD